MVVMNIEFVDGKSGDYDVGIDIKNRVLDILDDSGDRVGFFPFEAVIAVGEKRKEERGHD